MSGTGGNLSGSRLSVIPVDGGELQPGPGSENDEAILDVEDVSAMAPEADIDVYEAPNTTFGTLDEYAAIINSDTDDIVSSSWAVCEQLAQVAEPRPAAGRELPVRAGGRPGPDRAQRGRRHRRRLVQRVPSGGAAVPARTCCRCWTRPASRT